MTGLVDWFENLIVIFINSRYYFNVYTRGAQKFSYGGPKTKLDWVYGPKVNIGGVIYHR